MDGTQLSDPVLTRLDASARRFITGPQDHRIHWAEWGPAEAPVLVMLHGAYGSWLHFVRNIDAFSDRYRVLVPDIPGYGRSDLPANLSIVAIGAAIAEGLEALVQGDSYDLFGFSFGGAVAGRLMIHHRDRIRSALLAAPAGIGSSLRPAMKGVRGKHGAALEQALAFNLRSIMFARNDTVTSQAIAVQQRGSMAARLRVERVDWGPGLRDAVADFPAPLSVIWGAEDSFVDPAEMTARPDRIRRWNPAADTHLIANTGHWVQYEAADQSNAILRDLLELRG